MCAAIAGTKQKSDKVTDLPKPALLFLFILLAMLAIQNPLPLLLDYQLNYAATFIWLIYLCFGLRWGWMSCLCLGAAVALNRPDYGSHFGFWKHWAATGVPHGIAMLMLEMGAVAFVRRKQPKKNLVLLVGEVSNAFRTTFLISLHWPWPVRRSFLSSSAPNPPASTSSN